MVVSSSWIAALSNNPISLRLYATNENINSFNLRTLQFNLTVWWFVQTGLRYPLQLHENLSNVIGII